MGEFFFTNCMFGLVVACGVFLYINRLRRRITILNGNSEGVLVDETSVPGYTDFKLRYLAGYALAVFGDWVQGPYLYALYESFGYSRSSIAFFYIVGYASSLFFGTVVGSLADKYGIKNFVCLYGVIYGLSSLFKMVNNFFIIIVARLLSGIGTSLLFSVLEAWMVKVHKKRGYPENALAKIFSEATLVNGVTAIVAGVFASFASDSWGLNLGYRAPYAFAALDLFLMTAFVWVMWPCDRQDAIAIGSGSSGSSSGAPLPAAPVPGLSLAAVRNVLSAGVNDMLADKRVLYLCVVQSLFEGAMSAFVFVWTPTLLGACAGEDFKFASLGWVFASFMTAIVAGSQAFEYLTSTGRQANWIARINFAAAPAAMLVACVAAALYPAECVEYATATGFAYAGFAAFEVCCGIYFPVMSTLKSIYLPERSRAALMNFARIGLNAIIITVLLFAGVLSNAVILFICTALLAAACAILVLKLPITAPVQSAV